MVKIFLSSVLRAHAKNLPPDLLDGFDGSLDTLIERLIGACGPELGRLLIEHGELHAFLNAYVDGVDVRFTGGLSTHVSPNARVDLIPAVAGG